MWSSTLARTAATCLFYLVMPGRSGNSSICSGSGTLWSDSGEDGGSTGVVSHDAVTPVARETLLSVWTTSPSGI